MNLDEARAAFAELAGGATNHIELRVDQDRMLATQRCTVCKAQEVIKMEVSDEGDRVLFEALKAFQDRHQHKEAADGGGTNP